MPLITDGFRPLTLLFTTEHSFPPTTLPGCTLLIWQGTATTTPRCTSCSPTHPKISPSAAGVLSLQYRFPNGEEAHGAHCRNPRHGQNSNRKDGSRSQTLPNSPDATRSRCNSTSKPTNNTSTNPPPECSSSSRNSSTPMPPKPLELMQKRLKIMQIVEEYQKHGSAPSLPNFEPPNGSNYTPTDNPSNATPRETPKLKRKLSNPLPRTTNATKGNQNSNTLSSQPKDTR